MATVTGFTAERMLEIENTTVVDGEVDASGDLILIQRDGTPINAGSVEGPPGTTDHGAMTGLADDDHPQYLTNARGDARYDAIGGVLYQDHLRHTSGCVTETSVNGTTWTVDAGDFSRLFDGSETQTSVLTDAVPWRRFKISGMDYSYVELIVLNWWYAAGFTVDVTVEEGDGASSWTVIGQAVAWNPATLRLIWKRAIWAAGTHLRVTLHKVTGTGVLYLTSLGAYSWRRDGGVSSTTFQKQLPMSWTGDRSVTFPAKVTLNRDAVAALEAATKQQLDGKVSKAGDSMQGSLSLDGGGRNLDFKSSPTYDFCYAAFYPRLAQPTWRGFMGFPVAGSNDLYLENAIAGGLLILRTSGGRIDCSGDRVANIATPANGTDATNRDYVTGQDALKVTKTGDTMTGALRINDQLNLYNDPAFAPIRFFSASGTLNHQIYEASTTELILYAGSGSSSTAGTLSLSTTRLACPEVYETTTTTAVNINVHTDGTIRRSTSSYRYKHAIRGLDGLAVPQAPFDRTLSLEKWSRQNGSRPNPYHILRCVPASFVADATEDGLRTQVGLIAENVAAEAPWALSDSKDSIEWPSVTASLLQIVKDQQNQITQLTARVVALEGAAV
jgi:hypothetical protein